MRSGCPALSRFFPETNPRSVFRREYQSEIRQPADLLTADQVAVYPISATGLVVDNVTSADNYGKPLHDGYSNRAFEQIAMETLAEDTGGRAFYNTNGLGDAMTEAINNGSHYYTLTYTPTNTKADGKYRRIELTATNRAYRLAYRRGYYAENAKMDTMAEQNTGSSDPLLPFVSFGMPDFAEILYKVRVAALRGGKNTDPQKSVIRYGLDFAISPEDVKLETSPSGMRSGTIEVALIAYDHDGRVLNVINQKLPISIKPEVYPARQHVGLQLHEEIDLPKGEVYLQTGLYDLAARRAGTLGIPRFVTSMTASTK